MMLDARMILFGLHNVEGIGWKSIDRLVQSFQPLHNVLSANTEQLYSCLKDMNKVKRLTGRLTEQEVVNLWETYGSMGIEVITIWDDHYPELLKHTAKPPWVLYGKGRLGYLQKNALAIVGTRNPTVYGKRTAESLAYALSQHDVCVISGLARGIDSFAHIGALQGKGGTIAVLGTGIDGVYPPEHAQLAERIKEHGMLLSEFPIHTKGAPGLFPMRNRVIAGLSLGTLVVEAAMRSGSLITAAFATEESRDVFAVPGPISSPKSAGTIQLLKDGAKIVTSVEDILTEYIHLPQFHAAAMKSEKKAYNNIAINLTADELKILDLLTTEPQTFDQIMEQCQFEFGHLHSILLSLTIKKGIEQCSGSTYVRLYE